jgi:hypothetical protein
MADEKTVKDAFLDSVLRQIDSGEPPEARVTYDRLIDEGHSNNETLQLMAAVLKVETNKMLADSKPFDATSYAALLKKLPAID